MPSTNASSPSPSYPSGTKPGSMNASYGPGPRPPVPTSNYQGFSGPRPPMYPGQGNEINSFTIRQLLFVSQIQFNQYIYIFINFLIAGGQTPSGWQQRYPSHPPSGGSWSPQNGPRGPPPPGQWGPQSERSGPYPSYGPKPSGSWGPPGMQGQPGMRPPYRPDMRGPGSIPRPVSQISILDLV